MRESHMSIVEVVPLPNVVVSGKGCIMSSACVVTISQFEQLEKFSVVKLMLTKSTRVTHSSVQGEELATLLQGSTEVGGQVQILQLDQKLIFCLQIQVIPGSICPS